MTLYSTLTSGCLYNGWPVIPGWIQWTRASNTPAETEKALLLPFTFLLLGRICFSEKGSQLGSRLQVESALRCPESALNLVKIRQKRGDLPRPDEHAL